MNTLPTLPDVRPPDGIPHDYDVVIGPTADGDTNRALKFYYDGTYGDPGTKDAKEMLLRVLETDKLGVQLYVGSQSVEGRLVAKFESVDLTQRIVKGLTHCTISSILSHRISTCNRNERNEPKVG